MTAVLRFILCAALCGWQFSQEVNCSMLFKEINFMDVKTNYSEEIILVPFLVNIKMQSSEFFCYNTNDFQDLNILSYILCRHLGFLALKRIYPVGKHKLNISSDMGMDVNFQCSNSEILQDQCQVHSFNATSCYNYIGMKCTGCNETIIMDPDRRLAINFSDYLPCFPNSFCEWKIMTKQEVKELVLELKVNDYNENSSSIPMQFKNTHIEIQWPYEENEKKVLWAMNEDPLKHTRKLAIKSNTLVLKYFVMECDLVQRQNIQAVIWAEQSTDSGHPSTEGAILLIVLSIGILVVGTGIWATCTCCHWKKRMVISRSPSPFMGTHTRTVPDQIGESDNLVVAFRDVSMFKTSLEKSGEEDAEDSDDSRSNSTSPGSRRKFMSISKEDNGKMAIFSVLSNDEEASRKRCQSFVVKSSQPFSQSPETSKDSLQNIGEVSSAHPENYDILKENSAITGNSPKHRGFMQIIRHKFHSLIMKSSCSCPYDYSFLRLTAENCKELEESSLEYLLDKFNNVVLSFRSSDSSCSVCTVTDNSIQATDQKLIELVHQGTNLDFFLGQKTPEPVPDKNGGPSSPERWGSPYSESEVYLSLPRSISEESYFSAGQGNRSQTISDPETS